MPDRTDNLAAQDPLERKNSQSKCMASRTSKPDNNSILQPSLIDVIGYGVIINVMFELNF